ncbi:MAG: hypothetical protein KUG52_04920 [Immundisolibacteraceae bacterium]|nr:hypothetical protein [Immundisolibacteraceae bacterium]
MMLNNPLSGWIIRWLTKEEPRQQPAPCDFERICHEIHPGDVLLIEGRSRVSEVIRVITQSPWSHSVLYLGRLHDIENEAVRERISRLYDGEPSDPLILEAMLGEGVIVCSLDKYYQDHIRICRPRGLTFVDKQMVVNQAISEVGKGYNLRQLLDLGRFLFPWSFLPRRWRSVLFQHNVQETTKTVCSTVISNAFSTVSFPILPTISLDGETGLRMFQLDPRLSVPRDFDYSPYFDIIKYPLVPIDESGFYRDLPWANQDEEPDEQQSQPEETQEPPAWTGESGR